MAVATAKCDESGRTTPDLLCGRPTTPMGGQATHFIFHILFYFVLSFKKTIWVFLKNVLHFLRITMSDLTNSVCIGLGVP